MIGFAIALFIIAIGLTIYVYGSIFHYIKAPRKDIQEVNREIRDKLKNGK